MSRTECGLAETAVIADIGSGTGFLAATAFLATSSSYVAPLSRSDAAAERAYNSLSCWRDWTSLICSSLTVGLSARALSVPTKTVLASARTRAMADEPTIRPRHARGKARMSSTVNPIYEYWN